MTNHFSGKDCLLVHLQMEKPELWLLELVEDQGNHQNDQVNDTRGWLEVMFCDGQLDQRILEKDEESVGRIVSLFLEIRMDCW